MTGRTSRTISPSSSSTSRSTPWVEGCWGPMLMVMRPLSASSSSTKAPWERSSNVDSTRCFFMNASPSMPWREVLVLDGDLPHRVVLPQGVALPLVRHEDARQVGMALEDDAEQVVGLAFVPVGPGPDAGHRGDPRRVGVVDADDESEPAGRGHVGERADDVEAGAPVRTVGPAEVRQEAEALLVAQPEGH